MIASRFLIQAPSGLYVAPVPSRQPLVADIDAAAVLPLVEAQAWAEDLIARTGMPFRLVSAFLEFESEQSVDLLTP